MMMMTFLCHKGWVSEHLAVNVMLLFKNKPTTRVPDKRLFDNNNSLHVLVKKSKVSPFDDHNEDEDDIL